MIALDLSSQVGFAVGALDARPLLGTWVLPQIGGEGARFASFENELADAMALHVPDLLALEAPLPLPAQNNAQVARQQMGLRAIALSEAYRASAAAHEVDVYTVRRDVIGTGRFPAGKAKDAVMAYAKDQGYDPPDHNAGDALILWLYYARRMLA